MQKILLSSLATSSLLPYLTIHMQSIGITVEEIAIIYLALPFTTFLAPPITGNLQDLSTTSSTLVSYFHRLEMKMSGNEIKLVAQFGMT